MRNKLAVVFIVFSIFLIISCSKDKSQPAEIKTIEKQDTTPMVKTTFVKKGSIEEKLFVTGSLEAWDEVKVSSKIQGRVEQVFFDEGDYVKEGKLLFNLEDAELILQLKQSEIGIKSSEVLIEKAKISFGIIDTKISASLKQNEANIAASQAVLDKVKSGARQEEKEQARLGVEQSQINIDNAKINLDRTEKLYKSASVSKPQYEAAKLQYDLAESRLKIAKEMKSIVESGARDEDKSAALANVNAVVAAKEVIETAKEEKKVIEQDIKNLEIHLEQSKIAIEQIKLVLENTKIFAPMSGVIVKKSINPGEIVAPGVPAFLISKMEQLKLKAEIPENEIAKIKLKLNANISLDSYPDKPFEGEIIYINPIINSSTRTCGIEIKIPNPDKLLKPGMFARVAVLIGKKENALIVPKDILVLDEEKYFLYLVNNDIAVKKYVKIGLIQNENLEILEGINDNDEIVLVGKEYIADGAKVQVMRE